jgi:hypothetical protein
VLFCLQIEGNHADDEKKSTTTTTTMARPLKTKSPLGAMNSVRFELSIDAMLCKDSVARGVSKSDIIRAAVAAYYAPAVQVTQVAAPAKAKAKAKAKR